MKFTYCKMHKTEDRVFEVFPFGIIGPENLSTNKQHIALKKKNLLISRITSHSMWLHVRTTVKQLVLKNVEQQVPTFTVMHSDTKCTLLVVSVNYKIFKKVEFPGIPQVILGLRAKKRNFQMEVLAPRFNV